MYHIYDVIDDAQTKGLLKMIELRTPARPTPKSVQRAINIKKELKE